MSLDEHWAVPRAWEGARVFVIGGGPSFDRELATQIRRSGYVVCCNSAYVAFPTGHVVCWSDDRWFRWNHIALAKWGGTYRIARKKPPIDFTFDVKLMRRAPVVPGTPLRPLSDHPQQVGGFCTGAMGINIAYLFGGSEIILCGFDMARIEGRTHWHQEHRTQTRESQYTIYADQIEAFAPKLAKAGVKVWDTSLNGRLKSFSKINIKEFL